MNISNFIDYVNISDYDNITFTNCTNTGNDVDNIIFKYLLLSIPSSIFLFSLISLMVYTLIKPLIKKRWRNFFTQNIQFVVS